MNTMGFDAVTPFYDFLAGLVFGQKLQRGQTLFLDEVPAGATVLIVGGGTGRLLGQVLTRCRPTHVLYLETSARMLARATRRVLPVPGAGPVIFRVGDESSLRPDEQFDVIMTPFVLDLYTEATLTGQLIPGLKQALKPRGRWIVTDFVLTNVWWQNALIQTMIRFFRLTAGVEIRQLADWQQLLAQAGLVRQAQQSAVGGMVSAEVWMTE